MPGTTKSIVVDDDWFLHPERIVHIREQFQVPLERVPLGKVVPTEAPLPVARSPRHPNTDANNVRNLFQCLHELSIGEIFYVKFECHRGDTRIVAANLSTSMCHFTKKMSSFADENESSTKNRAKNAAQGSTRNATKRLQADRPEQYKRPRPLFFF